jgi:hypothetical protein
MKAPDVRRHGTRRVLTALLGAAGCFATAAPAALAADDPPPPGAGVSQAPTDKPAATPERGMTVYIDPQTGAVRQTPAPGTVPLQLTPQEQRAFSSSHQDLTEVPNPQPGGGVKLDLQGRFQSPVIGTIGPDGKLRMQHLGDTPKSGEQK